MPRCPIVTPETVRLSFVDVHRRAHQTLEAEGKATPDDLAASLDRIAAAEDEGDWLDVKRRLNTGEHRKMITDQYKETTLGNGLTLDLNKFGMSRVLAYVLGWSFVDLEGKPLPFSQSALEHCDFETWTDVLALVDDHHQASEAESAVRKNARARLSGSKATSPSPDAVIGPTTTS